MFQSLAHVAASPLTYLIVFGLATLDAFFPVVPSETAVIAASALAAQGRLSIWLIVPCAALGSFLGDNISYFLGRRLGEPAAARLFRGEKARGRLDWAKRKLDRNGAVIIVAARFIPGGRTAITFSAGMVAFPWRRFLPPDALAAVIWASYAAAIGYLGGRTFQHSTGKALLLAFGIVAAVALLVEVGRRVRAGRRGE